MRREQNEVESRNTHWIDTGDQPIQPTLSLTSYRHHADLRDRLNGNGDELLPAKGIDVAFRYQSAATDADASGVLGVTNRMTGAYILEVTTAAELIHTVTDVATRYAETCGTDRRYTLQLGTESDLITSYDKRTLLVYAQDGTLLRQHSLIPTGVEI